MTLQELFDTLLVERSVEVHLSKQQAESLRVQLVRKWNQYKVMMDSCGFLSTDLASCSLGRRAPATPDSPYTFVLAPRQRSAVEYTVVTTTTTPLVDRNQDAPV